MSMSTFAEVMRVGAETYEHVELCVACNIESANLTATLIQANKIITNTLT